MKKANVGIAVKGATDAARSASDIVFLAPGLSVIIDALITRYLVQHNRSRKIFYRIEGFMQYRVALSIHLLLCSIILYNCRLDLTISVLLFARALSSLLVVFLAIFSDIAVLTVAYDRASYSKTPIRWNVHRLIGVSLIIGIILTIGSFVMHYITLNASDMQGLTDSVVFLELALTQNWIIMATRSQVSFYDRFPCWQLIVAVLTIGTAV